MATLMDGDRPQSGLRARFIPNPAAIIVVCAIGLTILGLTVLFSASAAFKQGPFFYLSKAAHRRHGLDGPLCHHHAPQS